MLLDDDFINPFVQEVLMDTAENFFGARRRLDNMMDLFRSYVEALRKKEAYVAGRAGILNYLLLDAKGAYDFCKTINATPSLLMENELSCEILPDEIPFALTAKGEFVCFVRHAYDELQKACDEHMNGEPDESPVLRGMEKNEVYHKLLVKMCHLINENVQRVNTDMSPLSVLQFAKRLDIETQNKEYVTGGMTFDGSGINEKLAYQPIDFDSLGLKEYPELPPPDQVASKITAFCKKNYPENRKEIKRRISDFKKKIQHADAHIGRK